MKQFIKDGFQGIAFGAVDGVVLALGVLTGMSVLGDRTTVFLSLFATGIADAFGNAVGMHVEEESEGNTSRQRVWATTILTFIGTIVVFVVLITPIMLFPLSLAVRVSWVVGMLLLMGLGAIVATLRGWKKRMISVEYATWGAVASVVSYILVGAVKGAI
ncbi:MAG: hypothetical protein HZB68_02725 [Candidatus Aenigmarchaeota archaeon]|nr:hypothetical protein [Candidatus Aenigmarchaeota archaeon]